MQNYRHFVYRSITEDSRRMRRSASVSGDEHLRYYMVLWLLLIVAIWSGIAHAVT
jgi:hypothetical protein